MKLHRKILLTLVALVGFIAQASAQYYSWGADPARFKWMKATSDKTTVIYPMHSSQIGLSTFYLANKVKPSISYGFKLPPLDLPFVVHPENMNSNGLVMWLPKRVEFLSSPSINSYSMPWIKQLVAHEYRHAAQYNNINVGVVKFLSYLLGEQSSTIGLVFMPLWMMEGDATMFETQASSFGRALQPSFTLEYRAMGNIADKYRNSDTFFCGSYREFIPNHYQLGYQLVAHGNELAGRIMANDMAGYGPRKPWTIVSENWRMKNLFGFSTVKLFQNTFRYLSDFWASLPKVENSAEQIAAPQFKSYTKYADPVEVDGKLLFLKEDLDKPSRLVLLDPATGAEEHICYTGPIATRPAYDHTNNRIWWTEYRRSPLFEQKVTSTLRYINLDGGKPRTKVVKGRNILYPTPDDNGGMAWIEYAADGIYSFHRTLDNKSEKQFSLPFGIEVHSLAWDNLSRSHYAILTGDKGMWIACIAEDNQISNVTEPAYITLSKLRARDGKLYFGSIASGRDEVHCYDLQQSKEYQISESVYGSFDPAPLADGRVVMTTYDSIGYHPTVQSINKLIGEVAHSTLPKNLVNPPRTKWDIINLDSVSIATIDSTAVKGKQKVHRYRKGLTLFNIHSWAPLSYDPFALSEDGAINMNVGATIMTQNLLSSMQGFFSYGYSGNSGSIWKASLRYYGLGPTISLNATYGGRQNIYPIYVYNPEKHEMELPEAPTQGKYYSIGLNAQFPLLFQRGYHNRYLILSGGWEFSNGLVANTGRLQFDTNGISNVATIGYKKGLHLTQFSVGFQDVVQQAHRDFLPPWGVVTSATYAVNPADGSFSDLLALYAKIYTPGFAPHNSLNLALAYQTSIGGFKSDDALSALTFKSSRLLLRGFYPSQIENRNYMAASLNYQFPIWYPDGGIEGILYFKRVRLNFGFDIAQYQKSYLYENIGLKHKWHRLNSWGGDIIVDMNFLSQPAAATTAMKLSFYRPSEGKFFFSMGVELPF